MINPTIGRVVLFWPEKPTMPQQQPFPALVCFVHDERKINVGGYTDDCVPFGAPDITLLQDDDAIPEDGPYATWMPYQVATAMKAAAEAANLSAVPAAADFDKKAGF